MKALWNLFKQDALLSWRNGLILVTVITLAIIIGLFWTLPLFLNDEISFGPSQLYLDQTADGSVTELLAGAEFADSMEELRTAVSDADGLVGIAVTGDRSAPEFEIVYKHVPDSAQVNILEAALREIAATLSGADRAQSITARSLRPGTPSLQANQSLITVMLAFEVMILGFLFVAVVVFGEKTEGSIRAYRVTPSGVGNYVISKIAVFTIISTAYGIVMVASTLGVGSILQLLPVLLLSTALMSALGLGVSVFFKNISEWFVPGVLALSVNMLAILPYQIPTFSARWLTFLPGYAVIFGATEILFPTGKSDFAGSMYLTLGVWFVVAILFAALAVRRNVMKEA